MNDRVDLCANLLVEMKHLEFSDYAIEFIKNNELFKTAESKDEFAQKTYLTMLLYRFIVYNDLDVPNSVRMSLQFSSDPLAWFDDIKLSILPYLKLYEDKVFK